MKNFPGKIFIPALLLFAASDLLLASSAGVTAAEFIRILPGARPAAMGGAFTAVSDDKLALYYNPAGLSQLRSSEVSATYNKWIMDTSVSNIIYAHTFEDYGSAAAGITYYDSGPLDAIGETRDALSGGVFRNSGLAFVMGYGNEFFEGFSAGLAAKFISESLDTESTSGFAADIGVHYKTIFDFGEMSAGASLKNIGSKLWESYSLPMSASIGLAAKPVKNFLLVAADWTMPLSKGGGTSSGGVGFEVTPSDSVALRAGYKIGADDVSGLSALTFGFGYKYITESEEDGSISEYIFGYGFSTQGDLGILHRVEIGYAF